MGIAASRIKADSARRLGAGDVEPERGYGWLGAVIPADAKRFRVADAALAAVLIEAGAELVAARPDVEIAPVPELRGEASLAVAVLGRPARAGRPFPIRVLRRLATSLLVRLEARSARRVVRQLGYTTVSTSMWDHEMPVRSAIGGGRHFRARLIECLPQRAVVIADSAQHRRTLLDEALAAASRATGTLVTTNTSSVRAELLIADTNQGVLRMAVGAGRRQIVRQRAALASLLATNPPPVVADRLPTILASGRCGIGDWSLERKLPGSRPGAAMSRTLFGDCVDFLVVLHSADPTGEGSTSLAEQADVIAEACASEQEEVVRRLV